jgi:Matrixin
MPIFIIGTLETEMKNWLLIITLMGLYGCNSSTSEESDVTSGKINAAAPYMWPISAFPHQLKISTAFTSDESAAMVEMGSAWESSISNRVDFFNMNATTSELAADFNLDALGSDGISGIYKIENWPTSLNGSALAVTQIFGRRFNIGTAEEYVSIQHADILVNYDYFSYRTSDPGAVGTYDLKTVILHEMGHYLGLGHRYGSSVMIPSVGSSTKNQAPKLSDVTDLFDRYQLGTPTNGQSQMIAALKPGYEPKNNDQGQEMKMLIELNANGECRHILNGKLTHLHHAW